MPLGRCYPDRCCFVRLLVAIPEIQLPDRLQNKCLRSIVVLLLLGADRLDHELESVKIVNQEEVPVVDQGDVPQLYDRLNLPPFDPVRVHLTITVVGINHAGAAIAGICFVRLKPGHVDNYLRNGIVLVEVAHAVRGLARDRINLRHQHRRCAVRIRRGDRHSGGPDAVCVLFPERLAPVLRAVNCDCLPNVGRLDNVVAYQLAGIVNDVIVARGGASVLQNCVRSESSVMVSRPHEAVPIIKDVSRSGLSKSDPQNCPDPVGPGD